MRPPDGSELTLDVGAVAHGGHCVARHEGQVVFVRHTLPGERVVAVVTGSGPGDRFLRADAVQVLVASPDRVAPPCPYAGPGRCGGCDWQHAARPAQLDLKAAVVAEQLRRLGGVPWPVVVETVPLDGVPDDGSGWRTRVAFAADSQGRLGLRRHRSHQVVPVEACLIADRAVDEIGVLGVFRGSWPAGASVEVVASSTGDRAVIVSGAGPTGPGVLPELPPSVSVLIDEGGGTLRRLRGRATVRERAAGRSLRVTGSGFWQVHPKAADVLVDAVLDALLPRPGDVVLDLYSGVGLFAGAVAGLVAPGGAVTAIESDAGAVRDARRNLHDHPEVRLVTGPVDRVLHGVTGPTDLVVLDPPRRGAGRKVVETIASRGPRAVAYVACDPAALGRDVAIFGERGYRLAGLRCFDLFPMTHHVECVALMTPGQSAADG